jgi:hypothetical protein
MRITTKERMLRHQLDTAVTRIHAALSQCPADLENLDPAGLELAAALVDEANSARMEAVTLTSSLELLEAATQEAILLATSSRMALAMVATAISLLQAELDQRRAA